MMSAFYSTKYKKCLYRNPFAITCKIFAHCFKSLNAKNSSKNCNWKIPDPFCFAFCEIFNCYYCQYKKVNKQCHIWRYILTCYYCYHRLNGAQITLDLTQILSVFMYPQTGEIKQQGELKHFWLLGNWWKTNMKHKQNFWVTSEIFEHPKNYIFDFNRTRML